MEPLDLDFEWPRATYSIKHWPNEPSETALVSVSEPKIHRIDRKSLETAVIGIAGLQHMADEGVLERRIKILCDHLGMLENPSRKGQAEPMRTWIYASETIDGIFRRKEWQQQRHPNNKGIIGSIDMMFVPNSSGGFRLAFRPARLFDAIMYTAARMKAIGVDIRNCEWCAKPFQTGGRVKARKIASAKFCSDQCRYDFNNARRRKA